MRVIDELLAGASTEEEIAGPGGLLAELTKRLVERWRTTSVTRSSRGGVAALSSKESYRLGDPPRSELLACCVRPPRPPRLLGPRAAAPGAIANGDFWTAAIGTGTGGHGEGSYVKCKALGCSAFSSWGSVALAAGPSRDVAARLACARPCRAILDCLRGARGYAARRG